MRTTCPYRDISITLGRVNKLPIVYLTLPDGKDETRKQVDLIVFILAKNKL